MRNLVLAATLLAPLPAAAWTDYPTTQLTPHAMKVLNGGSGGSGGAGGAGGLGGNGGLGGAGGRASAKATASASPSSSATIAAGAFGGGSVSSSAPPAFGLPSFGGGQCATVGFGLAVSPSGGGAIGPAWESTNCRNYYIAETLISMGYRDAGLRLMAKITPEAAAAIGSIQQVSATQTAPGAAAAGSVRPAWEQR